MQPDLLIRCGKTGPSVCDVAPGWELAAVDCCRRTRPTKQNTRRRRGRQFAVRCGESARINGLAVELTPNQRRPICSRRPEHATGNLFAMGWPIIVWAALPAAVSSQMGWAHKGGIFHALAAFIAAGKCARLPRGNTDGIANRRLLVAGRRRGMGMP